MTHFNIDSSSPQFLSWVDSLPASSLKNALSQASKITSSDTTSKSQKKAQEHDILALILPPPSQALLHSSSMNDVTAESFGIERASNQSRNSGSEQAAALAGITSWAKSGGNPSENLLQSISFDNGKNPLEKALLKYIAEAPSIGADAHSLQQAFHKLGVSSSLFYGIDPEIVTRACTITEQQITLHLLDAWAASEQLRSQKMQEQMKLDDIQIREVSHRLLKDYTQDVEEKRQSVAQPVLAIFIGMLAVGIGAVSAIPLVPGIETVAFSTVQTIMNALGIASTALSPFTTELMLMVTGLFTATAGWATPTALSLFTETRSIDGNKAEQQITRDSARAFAITLATFLTNSQVQFFLHSRLERASVNGLIPKEMVDRYMAAIKISLLIETLALLYKIEHGGITSLEIKEAIFSSPFPDDSLLSLYVKLIQEERNRLSQDDDARLMNSALLKYDSLDYMPIESIIEPIRTFLSLFAPTGIESHIVQSEKA
ncbi:MAG: hypothetical protein QRY74_02770 [Chlamydia sp.]